MTGEVIDLQDHHLRKEAFDVALNRAKAQVVLGYMHLNCPVTTKGKITDAIEHLENALRYLKTAKNYSGGV